jgi:hypothetical protein
MKSYEFLREEDELSSIEANVLAALNLLAGKIKSGELPNELPTNMVIRYVRNTGISNFSVDNLVDLNEKNASLKNILKSISGNRIVFSTDSIKDTEDDDIKSDTDDNSQEPGAENTVSRMAKSALKRRS